MGPVDAIKTGFRKAFVFSGRASRSEFWFFYVFYSLIVFTVLTVIFDPLELQPSDTTFWVLPIVSCAASIPTFSVLVRRWHDTNHSAWWFVGIFAYMIAINQILNIGNAPGAFIFLLFAPLFVVMFWIQIVLYFLPGTTGPNQYGDDQFALNPPG